MFSRSLNTFNTCTLGLVRFSCAELTEVNLSDGIETVKLNARGFQVTTIIL